MDLVLKRGSFQHIKSMSQTWLSPKHSTSPSEMDGLQVYRGRAHICWLGNGETKVFLADWKEYKEGGFQGEEWA